MTSVGLVVRIDVSFEYEECATVYLDLFADGVIEVLKKD